MVCLIYNILYPIFVCLNPWINVILNCPLSVNNMRILLNQDKSEGWYNILKVYWCVVMPFQMIFNDTEYRTYPNYMMLLYGFCY